MEQTQHKHYSAGGRQALLVLFMCLFSLVAVLFDHFGLRLGSMAGLVIMAGVFAVIFSTMKSPIPLAIGMTLSLTLLMATGGFFLSLSGVVSLLCAIVMAQMVKKRAEKTTVLVTLSVILGGGLLLLFLAEYALDGGSLAPSELMEQYHAFFKEMKVLLTEDVKEMVDGIDENTLALYAQWEVTKEMLLQSYLDTMTAAVDLAELLLPGILILTVQLLAYILISAFRLAARLVHVEALLPAPHWYLFPTQISCVVYIIVSAIYLLASFFMEADSTVMVVLMNLWLTLLPVMLLCGVRVLLARLAHPMYRARTSLIVVIFVFGFFFLAAVAFRLALFVLSFLGAQTISTIHMVEAEKNKKK